MVKKYIAFNTEKKNAANSFEKDFSKLMINCIYGKAKENLRKIINARLVNNAKDYRIYISKRKFVSQKICIRNFVIIFEIKPILTLYKPIYVEFSILDLSKHWIYESHYKYIKIKYDANLLFTETDRLIYEVEIYDVWF